MSIIDQLPTLQQVQDELMELDSRRQLLMRLKAAIKDKELSPAKRAAFLRSLRKNSVPKANNANSPDSR